jgi:hypothetical protein
MAECGGPLIVRIPVKITFIYRVPKKNFLRRDLKEWVVRRRQTMYIFSGKSGGRNVAGPFFCRKERMRGKPYEIRKNYFIIPYTD